MVTRDKDGYFVVDGVRDPSGRQARVVFNNLKPGQLLFTTRHGACLPLHRDVQHPGFSLMVKSIATGKQFILWFHEVEAITDV